MKLAPLLLVALMLAAPLAVVTPVTAAPDRPPVVNAGSDQAVDESDPNCTDPDDGFGVLCSMVAINLRYAECGESGLTYDPDCENLKFSFRATPVQCNPDPTEGPPGGGVPCIPIGDGSKFIDETNFPFSTAPAIISSQNCQRPASTLPGTPPDIRLFPGDTRGFFGDDIPDAGFYTFEAPDLNPGQTTACIYSIDVLASDGVTPRPPQPSAPSAGVTDYTLGMDTIVITVNPVAAQPIDRSGKVITSLCDRAFPDPNSVCKASTAADIIDDHGKFVVFQYGPITHDKETRVVQLLLNMSGEHAVLVPLTTKVVPAGFEYQANPHRDETSYWIGQIPVDTPALIAGTYLYHTRAYDGEGGVSIHEGQDDIELGELEVTSALPPDDTLSYPCPLYPGHTPQVGQGNAPCILPSTETTGTYTPNNCFPGTTQVEPLVLGTGETVRPQVFWPYFNPEAPIAPIYDHNLLGWKLTYQSCIRSTNINGTSSFLAYGPEIELKAPYAMSLDTLFDGPQEVMLRAYDRIGSDIVQLVVPLIEDRAKPVFVTDIADVNYEGIPFQMIVYVQDDIATTVDLHIDGFNRTAAGKAVHYDDSLTANQVFYDRNGTEVTLPRLGDMVPFDIAGKQDFKTACDMLFDRDGDGFLDRAYRPSSGELFELLPVEGATGVIDFVVDVNGNGAADLGEALILGDATTGVKNANKCIDPFADKPYLQWFLSDAPTQVFVFNVTRYRLGETDYRLTIQDVVFNRFADGSHSFKYGISMSPTFYLTGTFETRHAVVDAHVDEVKVVGGPFLAGDKVTVTVTASQDSRMVPAVAPEDAPIVPLRLELSMPGSGECLNPASQDLRQCLRICPITTTNGCEGVPTAPGAAYTTSFIRPLEGYNPATIDPYNIVPDLNLAPPEVVAIAYTSYPAGSHRLQAEVLVPDVVDDEDYANNAKATTLDIFIGQVVVGAYPAKSVPQGRVFYIRAERGSAQINDGAVEVNATGGMQAYDLRLNQNGTAPRYDFKYIDDKGQEQTAYWEPQTRYSRTFGKPCNQLTAAENVTDMQASPVKDPQCRSITVIGPAKATPPEAKGSPGLEPFAVLVAIALLAFLRRRR